MSDSHPLAVIVGAGPGLGAALAARFAAGGCALALLSRSAGSRDHAMQVATTAGVPVQGYDCDAGHADSVAAAFARIRQQQGNPRILIYNAGIFLAGGVLELEPAAFEAAWRTNCLGAFLTAREVLPAMREAGAGTVLLTGATAALRGGKGFAGIAVGKFGLRALAQSMAREFGPQGIHVAHVVVDGQIATPGTLQRQPDRARSTLLDPGELAQIYWQLHEQPRSTWTLELDVRPHVESF